MRTYTQLMNEMALDIGRSYSPLNSYKEMSRNLYNANVNVAKKSTGIEVVKVQNDPKSETHFTMDHDSKRAIHYSTFVKDESTLSYHHLYQAVVDREKEHPSLVRGYATDHAYNHWNFQKLPLRSSSEQYQSGHVLWHRLVDRALDNGKFVYHVNEKGEHTRLNHENKSEFLDSYFGKGDPEYRNRHIVISHTLAPPSAKITNFNNQEKKED